MAVPEPTKSIEIRLYNDNYYLAYGLLWIGETIRPTPMWAQETPEDKTALQETERCYSQVYFRLVCSVLILLLH